MESEKYKALQKEINEAVSLGRAEKDVDIAPAFDYFEKGVMEGGLSEIQAEKLFWQVVVEKIKEIRFKTICRIIHPEIESGDYVLARKMLMEELNKTIE